MMGLRTEQSPIHQSLRTEGTEDDLGAGEPKRVLMQNTFRLRWWQKVGRRVLPISEALLTTGRASVFFVSKMCRRDFRN
jgi:hypothetical protein